mmetsp:Transcript_91930/g.231138  ORF Transcript_91930/g.231138 Transcript_91930/m.231138 type:complete len:415 (-) Transcript_91930:2015-3259(-)
MIPTFWEQPVLLFVEVECSNSVDNLEDGVGLLVSHTHSQGCVELDLCLQSATPLRKLWDDIGLDVFRGGQGQNLVDLLGLQRRQVVPQRMQQPTPGLLQPCNRLFKFQQLLRGLLESLVAICQEPPVPSRTAACVFRLLDDCPYLLHRVQGDAILQSTSDRQLCLDDLDSLVQPVNQRTLDAIVASMGDCGLHLRDAHRVLQIRHLPGASGLHGDVGADLRRLVQVAQLDGQNSSPGEHGIDLGQALLRDSRPDQPLWSGLLAVDLVPSFLQQVLQFSVDIHHLPHLLPRCVSTPSPLDLLAHWGQGVLSAIFEVFVQASLQEDLRGAERILAGRCLESLQNARGHFMHVSLGSDREILGGPSFTEDFLLDIGLHHAQVPTSEVRALLPAGEAGFPDLHRLEDAAEPQLIHDHR